MSKKRAAGGSTIMSPELYMEGSRDSQMKKDRGEYKRGGATGTGKAEVYTGAGSETIKSAEERKRGGKVESHDEKKRKKDHEKLKRGGAVHKKAPMMAEGEGLKRHRLDRPGRKRGGGVGADLSPLTTAAKIVEPAKGLSRDVRVDQEQD